MAKFFRIMIPRDQPDMVFTDEAWKDYVEQIKEKYRVVEETDESVTYEDGEVVDEDNIQV